MELKEKLIRKAQLQTEAKQAIEARKADVAKAKLAELKELNKSIGSEKRDGIVSLINGEVNVRPVNPEVRKAYSAWARTGENRAFMNTEVGSSGGLLVLPEYEGLIKQALAKHAVYDKAKKLTTSGKSKTIIYRNTLPTPAYAYEGAARNVLGSNYSESLMGIGEKDIKLNTAAFKVPVSKEMLEDASFDFESELMQAANDGIAALVGQWLAIGNSHDVEGLISDSALGYETASTGTIVEADMNGLVYSVDEEYAMNGNLVTKRGTIGTLSGIYKNNSGVSIIEHRDSKAFYDGYEVLSESSTPAIAAGNKAVGFGDIFRAYTVVTKTTPLSVIRDQYTEDGIVLFKFAYRIGGGFADASAFKHLLVKA